MVYERSEEILQPLEQLLSHPAVTLTKGSKKRFEAQQMMLRLGTLAHNVIVWRAAGWRPTNLRRRAMGSSE